MFLLTQTTPRLIHLGSSKQDLTLFDLGFDILLIHSDEVNTENQTDL